MLVGFLAGLVLVVVFTIRRHRANRPGVSRWL